VEDNEGDQLRPSPGGKVEEKFVRGFFGRVGPRWLRVARTVAVFRKGPAECLLLFLSFVAQACSLMKTGWTASRAVFNRIERFSTMAALFSPNSRRASASSQYQDGNCRGEPGGGSNPAGGEITRKREQACKPNSVTRRSGTAIIHLVPPLLAGSSDLPESYSAAAPMGRRYRLGGAGRPSSPIWSCSVWGFPCPRHRCRGGALLPVDFGAHGSVGQRVARWRPHLFTLTHVRLRRTAAKTKAVSFLWHFPCRRRTVSRHPPPALAVSEHTALRSSDFPLPHLCSPTRNPRGSGIGA